MQEKKFIKQCGWMDAWIYGYVDTWMDGWIHGWMDGYMDGWVDTFMDGRTNGYIDTWMDRWMHRWMGRAGGLVRCSQWRFWRQIDWLQIPGLLLLVM